MDDAGEERETFCVEISSSDLDAVRKEKFKIMKNILLICLSFLLNFTAFAGISNLQSSLNPAEGLGTGSLSIIYGSLIISAVFAPNFATLLYRLSALPSSQLA